MKRILILFLFLLTSCAAKPVSIPTAVVAPSETLSVASTPTATDVPFTSMPLPTATPIPCDPLVAEFCITDGHFVLQRPILPPDNDSVEMTYPFASTAAGTREAHHGVEFINATGVPVHAAADGEVIFAGPDVEAVYSPWKKFYGNVIVIRHTDEMFTLYAHLSVMDVEAGQVVNVGEKIGEVGWTGGAVGSHLHFEVRRGDVEDYFSVLNPELWLMPKTDEGALAISVVDVQGEFQRAEITIQSESGTYYIKTYEEVFSEMKENAALGLTVGRYRIAFLFGGKVYERWVEVELGRLTQVVFVVK